MEPVHYFRALMSSSEGEYGAGVWYAEFSDGTARRQFEVYSDRTLVAPYDLRFADQFDIVLADDHYQEIPLSEFQSAYEVHATPRLHAIASNISQ